MFKMRQSLMGVVTQKPKPPPALSPEELQLRQAKESLRELQAHLGVASGAARSLAAHMESLAEDLGALGRAMGAMARFEEGCAAKGGQYTPGGLAATQRAADLQQVGTSAAHAHAAMRAFAGRTSAALVVLHDYHVLIPEAISALEDRESALAVVDLLRDQLADREAALARTQAAQLGEQPGSPAAAGLDKKASQLAAAVIQLQDRLQTAAAHYDVLKVRNLSEVARLDQQRTTDLRDALRHFARVQAQCSSAVTEVWLPAAVGAQMPPIPE